MTVDYGSTEGRQDVYFEVMNILAGLALKADSNQDVRDFKRVIDAITRLRQFDQT